MKKKQYVKPTISKIGKVSTLTLGMNGAVCDANNAATGFGMGCAS